MKLNYSDIASSTDVKINSYMEIGDEIIVPGYMEDSCNMVSSIWSIEVMTYRSICDKRG